MYIKSELFSGSIDETFDTNKITVSTDLGYLTSGFVTVDYYTDATGQPRVAGLDLSGHLSVSQFDSTKEYDNAFNGVNGNLSSLPAAPNSTSAIMMSFTPVRLLQVRVSYNLNGFTGPTPIKVNLYKFKDTGVLASN